MSDLMLPAYQKLYAALQSLFPNGQRMSCMTCNGVMYAKVMSALESLTMMPLPTIRKNRDIFCFYHGFIGYGVINNHIFL